MHHHVLQFIADLLFVALVHGGPVPPARPTLAQWERDLAPVSVEQVLRSLDMRTLEVPHTSHPTNGGN